jgi:hypothetical protein
MFGEERVVHEKDVGGKKYIGNFAIFCKSINLVLVISSLSAKLVSACVASDVVSLVSG